MGGKFAARSSSKGVAAFVDGVPAEYAGNFSALRKLIKKVAPDATENVRWGTLAFDRGGNLFALSIGKTGLNFYILEIGIIAKHAALLAGITQGKCVLRFPQGAKLPLSKLEKVARAAVAAMG